MDDHEKRVFRRKRNLLAEHFNFSKKYQQRYESLSLLTVAMTDEAMRGQTDYGRTLRFLDLVVDISGAFQKVLDLLEEDAMFWIADEMRVDLLAERGELTIEDYIFSEAGEMVHKQFGQSRRVAETDKKDIQYCMAIRYQAAKEASKRMLDKIRSERDAATKFRWEQNERMKALIDKVSAFLRIHKINLHISSQSHAGSGAIHMTREDMDPDCTKRDYLRLSEQSVDKLMESLACIMLEKEKMTAERKRCLDVLQIDKPVASMDIDLQEALGRAAANINKVQQNAETSDHSRSQLEQRLARLTGEMQRGFEAKNRHIRYQEVVCGQRFTRIRHLEDSLSQAETASATWKEEADKWRKKCELLERTRRLGYKYPGWYKEKAYEVDEEDAGRDGDKADQDQEDNPSERKAMETAPKAAAKSASSKAVAPAARSTGTGVANKTRSAATPRRTLIGDTTAGKKPAAAAAKTSGKRSAQRPAKS